MAMRVHAREAIEQNRLGLDIWAQQNRVFVFAHLFEKK